MCTKCGSYADTVAKGLARPCAGRSNPHTRRCLKLLKSGKHPRSGHSIGKPVYEVGSIPTASSHQASGKRPLIEISPDAMSTADKMHAGLLRIRAKEAAARVAKGVGVMDFS